MRLSAWLAVVVALTAAFSAEARDIKVMGLFADRALVVIDGNQRFLRVNETSPEGIKLIAANPERAILEVDGKRETYLLGSDIHTETAPPAVSRVQIARNNDGMYMTAGSINGIPVSLLVDTGATSIAMNTQMAQKLGIAFRHTGKPINVSTANGVARAWKVKAKTVKVGEVVRHNVDAVVIEGAATPEILLGMSFLSTLKMREENQVLILETTH